MFVCRFLTLKTTGQLPDGAYPKIAYGQTVGVVVVVVVAMSLI